MDELVPLFQLPLPSCPVCTGECNHDPLPSPDVIDPTGTNDAVPERAYAVVDLSDDFDSESARAIVKAMEAVSYLLSSTHQSPQFSL